MFWTWFRTVACETTQLGGDLAGVEAVGEQPEDLPLPRGQGRERGGAGGVARARPAPPRAGSGRRRAARAPAAARPRGRSGRPAVAAHSGGRHERRDTTARPLSPTSPWRRRRGCPTSSSWSAGRQPAQNALQTAIAAAIDEARAPRGRDGRARRPPRARAARRRRRSRPGSPRRARRPPSRPPSGPSRSRTSTGSRISSSSAAIAILRGLARWIPRTVPKEKLFFSQIGGAHDAGTPAK